MPYPQEYPELYEALFTKLNPQTNLTDEDLMRMYQVFGSMLLPALNLVDKGDVVHISLPYNRSIYQVSSSAGLPYTIYPVKDLRKDRGFCPCEAFGYGAIEKGMQILCKHLLAYHIASRTNKMRLTQIGEEGIPALLGLSGLE